MGKSHILCAIQAAAPGQDSSPEVKVEARCLGFRGSGVQGLGFRAYMRSRSKRKQTLACCMEEIMAEIRSILNPEAQPQHPSL